MSRKLLFAVDFSPYTEKLVGCAGELGAAGIGDVQLLYVIEAKKHAEYGDHPDPAYVEEKRDAEEHLGKLAGLVSSEGITVNTAIASGNPAEEIVRAASENDVDLIFLGAHGRGFMERAFLGSVSEEVVKRADRPVLVQHCRVIRGDGGYSCENACTSLFGNILMATDFSRYGDGLKPLLVDLAETFCTPITLLHVQEGKEDGGYQILDDTERNAVRDKMDRLRDISYELSDHCESVRIDIVHGDPPSAILAYADEIDATLIVLGAFGSSGYNANKLGRVVQKVYRKSERPVMILKAGRGT